MLAPFPVFLRSSSSSTTTATTTTTTTTNDSGDNLSDIIDLFPYSVTPSYEAPTRPARNPDRMRKSLRAPPRYPPPTSPLPPLPAMYPVPGGLSPWSAPSYPSRSLPTPPSPPQSNFILRGPVGVRSAPGTLLPIPKAEDHSTPSDPALALNVHGGIDTSSRLHHRFRRQQVPYPRSYQRKVIDLDAIDTLLTRQMSGGSLTWHAFPQSWNEQPAQEPLKRILDVGCGDGVWVIEAAKYWKGCQVVGLDIVSLHPDLARLSRDKDLLKRISWVQANFLEGLPFPNESFDFVHVKRIARGVPENMWDDLFEEISRVMKPGAAFEVVEEDLSFPGRSDGEGSEVGTLRSNISMSTYSLSLGTESGRCSAVGSMSSSSDFTRAVTTPDSVPSITINARSYRSIADNSPISVPDSPPVASNNTHPQPFIHRSLSSRQPPSPIRSNETLTLARPSTATTPSPSSPSHPFHSSSSSQSTFLSFSSNGSTPTPSMMSTSPRPPPSHKFNKAAQAVLMEPTLTPFFAGVGPITSSGSGSSSASLFSSSAVSGVALSTSPSSGNGVGASSTSSSGSPPVPQKKNKAAQAVLMEPTATPFFVLPQNKSRVSLMGESSSSGSGSSGSVRENGKGWSRGSFGGRVSVGLGLNLGFKSGTSPSLGSPGPGSPGTSSSSRMVEDELGDGLGTGGLESRFPVGTPPDSQLGAALGPSLLDSRGVVSPDSRGVIPPDPRDHTVLETIYNEMHAERFINLAPLSLLANTVGLWFKDVRTHPPILLRFPPLREPEDANTLLSGVASSSFGSVADRNTHSRNTIISLDGLGNGASPYASLDCAISIQRQTQTRALPNPALDVDLKFLNLHLALRVKEIVACAEAMWEWVREFQTRGTGRKDGAYAKIMGLTRLQFDELLLRFELDMREHMGLGSVLEDRFNWSMIPGPTPQEKRSFDTACEKWEAYQRLGDRTPCAVAVADPHPATRLSRSLRVFVAWKPTA